MILIDYSSTAIQAITGFREDLKNPTRDIDDLIRHVVISTIKGYKKKFGKEYGELVIACDSSPYWRKEIFPHYKHKRAKAREESDIPWKDIFRYMDQVRDDLIEHFPYKVIKVPGAEADDVIGVLTRERAFDNSGLFENEPSKTVIVTNDKDAKQLLTHPNIRQFSSREQKFVKLEEPAKMFLRRLILTGDSGDGIPNCFSPNDSFVTGIRQKAATEKKMAPMLEAENMLDAAPDEFVKQRIIENTRLIAFAGIPNHIRTAIHEAYDRPANGNKMSIFNYLTAKRMKLMIQDIEEF